MANKCHCGECDPCLIAEEKAAKAYRQLLIRIDTIERNLAAARKTVAEDPTFWIDLAAQIPVTEAKLAKMKAKAAR